MLDAIGAESVDDLFEQIPPDVRLDRDLDLPAGLTETECFDHLAELAERNASAPGCTTTTSRPSSTRSPSARSS